MLPVCVYCRTGDRINVVSDLLLHPRIPTGTFREHFLRIIQQLIERYPSWRIPFELCTWTPLRSRLIPVDFSTQSLDPRKYRPGRRQDDAIWFPVKDQMKNHLSCYTLCYKMATGAPFCMAGKLPFADSGHPFREIDVPLGALDNPRMLE